MTPQSKEKLFAPLTAFFTDFVAYASGTRLRAIGLMVSGALLEGVGLALIAPALAVLFGSGTGRLQQVSAALFGWTGLTSLPGRLALLLGIFVVAMIFRAVVILARDITLAKLRIGFVEAQRCRVAETLAAAPWDKVVRLRHARVTQVMSGDLQQIGAAAFYLTQCMTAAVMLAAQSALVVWLSPPLALVSFALLIAGALALFPMMRRANRLGSLFTTTSLTLLHGTAQFLGGLKLAVSQDLQEGFLAAFRTTVREQSRQQIQYIRQQTQSRLALATLSALIGAILVLTGLIVFQVPPALLVALLLVVVRMSGPSGQIQQGAQMLANALPAYDAVRSLQHDLAGDLTPLATGDGRSAEGEIQFNQVSFAHPQDGSDETHGVHDLTLTIAPGTRLGIKGPSGAGKTTLADLLAGLYPPQSGTITIGGQSLEGAVLAKWRKAISYVAQDPFLFHDTIRRNLSWANPAASEAEMWQALACVEAAAFVRALPAGLDTVVGERGTLLSGGERQRIALARAILRRPTLLLLDEATNALDPETEATIFARLAALTPRPTIVIIAHRPDCLAYCDRVLTMENGQLTEDRLAPAG